MHRIFRCIAFIRSNQRLWFVSYLLKASPSSSGFLPQLSSRFSIATVVIQPTAPSLAHSRVSRAPAQILHGSTSSSSDREQGSPESRRLHKKVNFLLVDTCHRRLKLDTSISPHTYLLHFSCSVSHKLIYLFTLPSRYKASVQLSDSLLYLISLLFISLRC